MLMTTFAQLPCQWAQSGRRVRGPGCVCAAGGCVRVRWGCCWGFPRPPSLNQPSAGGDPHPDGWCGSARGAWWAGNGASGAGHSGPHVYVHGVQVGAVCAAQHICVSVQNTHPYDPAPSVSPATNGRWGVWAGGLAACAGAPPAVAGVHNHNDATRARCARSLPQPGGWDVPPRVHAGGWGCASSLCRRAGDPHGEGGEDCAYPHPTGRQAPTRPERVWRRAPMGAPPSGSWGRRAADPAPNDVGVDRERRGGGTSAEGRGSTPARHRPTTHAARRSLTAPGAREGGWGMPAAGANKPHTTTRRNNDAPRVRRPRRGEATAPHGAPPRPRPANCRTPRRP